MVRESEKMWPPSFYMEEISENFPAENSGSPSVPLSLSYVCPRHRFQSVKKLGRRFHSILYVYNIGKRSHTGELFIGGC